MPDYTYYTEKYLGEDIPEAAFPRFARRAAEELARMQNIYPMAPCKGIEPDTAYAMAVCSIADAMYEFAQEDEARGLAKVSVGSVSETYAAPPELCAETIQSREGYLRALAQDYLVFGRYASGGAG